MNINAILARVAATSSRLEKEAILREHAGNETLQRVFKLAYDKQINFFISEAPEDKELLLGTTPPHDWASLDHGLNQLEKFITNRAVTGNAALALIKTVLASTSPDNRSVLRRVMEKDLRIGCSASTANKVWPGILPKPAFQLCETDTSAIVYPALSQIKEDGTRAELTFDGEECVFLTRNGNTIETHGVFDALCKGKLVPGTKIDGELVAFKDGKRLVRKESNGYVNKAVKGTISPEEAELLHFVAWDIPTLEDNAETRFRTLTTTFREGDRILVVETREVQSYEEAREHFKEARKRGLEGTIVKNLDAAWVGKRTKNCVKFKAEIEAEFRVVGVELGKGKNANRVGALMIESEDGLVKCDVGIFKDFPDSVRDEWLIDTPEIVTVRFNERIKSKDPKVVTWSLFLPRVISVRYDKTRGDTLLEIVQIEEAVLNG